MTFANVRVVGICALLAATLLAGRTAQAELTEKTVKVGNVTARVEPNGAFRAFVTLGHGVREVLIEVEDQDGNRGQKKLRL